MKRILFGLIWAMVISITYTIVSIVLVVVLNKAGILAGPPPREHSVGWYVFCITARLWAWSFWVSPVAGFALGFFGLPTTPRKTRGLMV